MKYLVKRVLHGLYPSVRLLPSIHYCLECGRLVPSDHFVKEGIKRAYDPSRAAHTGHPFGRRFPDRKYRSAISKIPSIMSVIPRVELPSEFTLTNVDGGDLTAPVDDQGSEGSCVGHGLRGMKGSQERCSGTWSGDPSARFGYNLSQYLGGYLGQEGANMLDAMNGLLTFGICREKFWESIPNVDAGKWPPDNPDALEDAENFKIESFADCAKDPDGSPARDPVDNIKQPIYQMLGAVDMGTPWTQSMMNDWPLGDLRLPPDNDSILGGHSYTIHGWSDSAGRFRFRNSWGKTNLLGGDGTMPYGILTSRSWQKAGGYEAYKSIDLSSVICPDGYHWKASQRECILDGATPQPKGCPELFQSCMMAATTFNQEITCIVDFLICLFESLGTPMSVAKSIGKSKKAKSATLKITEE